MINRLCVLLEKIPWIRNRFYQMKQRMFLYYPRDEETVNKKALFLCFKVWGVFLLGSLYFSLTIHGGYEEVCLAICIFYMFYRYILSRAMDKESRMLLEGMGNFLGELRLQYSYSGRIEEALEECLDRTEGVMYLHGKMVLDCLDDEDLEEHYMSKAPVRFLNQFLILCKSNFLYGDSQKDGKSVFLTNIGIVKESVEAELLKKKKIGHLFSGLLFTCMLPIGFIPIIERWAISNMEELKVYYYGTYGMITTLLLCLFTLLAYELVRHMQYEEPTMPVERKWLWKLEQVVVIDKFLSWQLNRDYQKAITKHHMLKSCGVKENVKQFLLLQYVTALVAMVVIMAGVLQYRNISRGQIVVRTEKMLHSIYQADEEQKDILSEKVSEMVKGKAQIEIESLNLRNCPQELKDAILKEIKLEREHWNNWNFPWYLWFLIPVGGVFAYHGRYGVLLVKKRYAGLKREEEILTFQTIIMCLMYVEQVSGEEILYWLEKVSMYFRESIEKFYYRIVYQNYEESMTIKEEENYVPMAMILEGIMACDKLPVHEAFFQMESDYHYTAEKYIQESNSYIRDKSAICGVLAFAPIYLTVGFKLIVPFVLEGLSQLAAYSESMQQFM